MICPFDPYLPKYGRAAHLSEVFSTWNFYLHKEDLTWRQIRRNGFRRTQGVFERKHLFSKRRPPMAKTPNLVLSPCRRSDDCSKETHLTDNPGSYPNANKMGRSRNLCQLITMKKGFEKQRGHRIARFPINLERYTSNTAMRSVWRAFICGMNGCFDWSDRTQMTLLLDTSSVFCLLVGHPEYRMLQPLASREPSPNSLSNEELKPVPTQDYATNQKFPYGCKKRSVGTIGIRNSDAFEEVPICVFESLEWCPCSLQVSKNGEPGPL